MNSASIDTPALKLLHAGIERGGFSTDDVLAVVLPLFRQSLAFHEQNLVAPLRLEGIQTADNKLLFSGEGVPPKRNFAGIDKLQPQKGPGMEILGETRIDQDITEAAVEITSFDIAENPEAITRPVYLPEYQTWEEACGHHDELTDIF